MCPPLVQDLPSCPAPWPLPCRGVPRTQLSSPPHPLGPRPALHGQQAPGSEALSGPCPVPLSLSVGSFASCLAETQGCGAGALTSRSLPQVLFSSLVLPCRLGMTSVSHPPGSLAFLLLPPLQLVWIPLLETQDGGNAQSPPSHGLRPPCCCPRASFLPWKSVLCSLTLSAPRRWPFPPRNLPEAEVLWVGFSGPRLFPSLTADVYPEFLEHE